MRGTTLTMLSNVHVVPDLNSRGALPSPMLSGDFDFQNLLTDNYSFYDPTELASVKPASRPLSRHNSEYQQQPTVLVSNTKLNWIQPTKISMISEEGNQDSRVPVKSEPNEDDFAVDVADLMTYAPSTMPEEQVQDQDQFQAALPPSAFSPSNTSTQMDSDISSSDDEDHGKPEDDEDDDDNDEHDQDASDVEYNPRTATRPRAASARKRTPSIKLESYKTQGTRRRMSSVTAATTSSEPDTATDPSSPLSVPQPAKRGRSRPKTKEELEAKKERMRVRQEKNRQAAKKCRERKQQYYSELEEEVRHLREENAKLASALKLSRQENIAMHEKYRVL